MHLYTVEMEDRLRKVGWLAVLATLASLGAGIALKRAFGGTPPAIGPPAAMAIFGGLLFVYDKWLWRLDVLGLRLSQVPRLDGSWLGEVTLPDDEGKPVRTPCLVEISQRWLRMSIVFHTAHTRSTASSATLRRHGGSQTDFRYEYHVRPREGGKLSQMSPHEGVARLDVVQGDWDNLEGDYFNDQHHQHSGSYWMRRQPGPVDTGEWLKRQQGVVANGGGS